VRLAARAEETEIQPQAGMPALQLAGAEFAPVWRPGEEHAVTLTWHAAEAVPTDYTVFLHLRDAAGQLVAQADGPPLGGWYPTSWWTAGEQVTDEHTFALPAGITSGEYRLVAGLYDPATGARLGEEKELGVVAVE
jgi:hypothetical protein